MKQKNFVVLLLSICMCGCIRNHTISKPICSEDNIMFRNKNQNEELFPFTKNADEYGDGKVEQMFDEAMNEEDPIKAIKKYDEIITSYPDYSSDAYVFRGSRKRDMGNLSGALQDFNEAIILDPSSELAYVAHAYLMEDLGNLSEAISDYDEAIRLNPKNSNTYYIRGLLKYNMEDPTGSMDDFNVAIFLNPDFELAYYNRGLLKLCIDDMSGAYSDFSEAIRLDPDYTGAYINRGILKYNMDDTFGALSDFNQAVRSNPDCANAYFNRAAYYEDMAKNEKDKVKKAEFKAKAKSDTEMASKLEKETIDK